MFNTIAAESQRLINETYSAFVQGFMPTLARPDVDVLDGLTTAIIVDQQRMGADPRSTVGTATDANAMLRILFSRLGAAAHRPAQRVLLQRRRRSAAAGAITVERGGKKAVKGARFSVTGGMCPRCEGRGTVNDIDLTQLYDDSKSLNEGALTDPRLHVGRLERPALRRVGLLRPGQADPRVHQEGAARLPAPRADQGQGRRHQHDLRGPDPARSRSRCCPRTGRRMQPHIRAFVERAVTFTTCPDCDGTRLSAGARSSKIGGRQHRRRLRHADQRPRRSGCAASTSPPSRRCSTRCGTRWTPSSRSASATSSLDRPAGTLSGGEAQRVKMIRHLGSSLTDVTYVFDEPTIGLHPHDIQRMNDLLLRLRDKGNTVLVVEHKPETIAIADHVVDLGPGAGAAGGTVCFEGTVEGLRASGTVTGRHLDDRAALKTAVREPTGALEVRGARPRTTCKTWTSTSRSACSRVVTGVAGSGKSSLVHGSLAGRRRAWCRSTRAPIRGSRRSNPATYTGLLDPIRKAFAKANGVKPALFSANSEGACPTCNGAGVVYTDLAMMAGVATTCEECEGKRFQAVGARVPARRAGHQRGARDAGGRGRGVLRRGRGPHPGRARRPDRLADVGLGYLSLGQPLTTLSGGERQRLKLATHMGEKGGVYVLDEPTTRPPPRRRRAAARRCSTGWSTSGKSVIVVEHHQAVMAHADWIIDLGPGAGPRRRPDRLRGHPGRPGRRRAPPSPASTSPPTSAPDPYATAHDRPPCRTPPTAPPHHRPRPAVPVTGAAGPAFPGGSGVRACGARRRGRHLFARDGRSRLRVHIRGRLTVRRSTPPSGPSMPAHDEAPR